MLSEDTLLMCGECRRESGNGGKIEVSYFYLPKATPSGWSPAWEGRTCIHATKADVLDHFGFTEEIKDGKYVKKAA